MLKQIAGGEEARGVAVPLPYQHAPSLDMEQAMAMDPVELLASLLPDARGETGAWQGAGAYGALPQPPAHMHAHAQPASPRTTTPPMVPPTAELAGVGLAAGSRNGPERKEWTTAEDEIIQSGVAKFGCKWRRIAEQLPGRSDRAVRNRWNRLKEARDGPPAEAAEGVKSSAPKKAKSPVKASVDPLPLSEYEKQNQKNSARNKAFLRELGLVDDALGIAKKVAPRAKNRTTAEWFELLGKRSSDRIKANGFA